MSVQPYLIFDGRCEEAIEFYKKALGAKVEMMMRFKDGPETTKLHARPTENKIMHSSLRIGDTAVMASDGMAQGKPEFKGFSLSFNANTEAEAERVFEALPRAARCQCRSPRPSSPRASAWSPTSSASAGWSTSPRRRQVISD